MQRHNIANKHRWGVVAKNSHAMEGIFGGILTKGNAFKAYGRPRANKDMLPARRAKRNGRPNGVGSPTAYWRPGAIEDMIPARRVKTKSWPFGMGIEPHTCEVTGIDVAMQRRNCE